jgi:hypothetical protein
VTKRIVVFAILILGSERCVCQPCADAQIDSARSAVLILTNLSPNETDPRARHCILAAINVASQFRDPIAIPQLVRYLTFHRDPPPEEANGVFFQTRTEGDDFPAILALARIGEPARQQLLQVIESDTLSQESKQNAAHALALSFQQQTTNDPSQSILYIRRAEPLVDTASKQRLDNAITYILTTDACKRFATKCARAASQPSPQ